MAKRGYKNIYLSTTIFAIIGTLVYMFLVYLFYRPYITAINTILFFIVVWIVYYFIAKSRYKKY